MLKSATTTDQVELILSLIDAEQEGKAVGSGDKFKVETLSQVAEFFGVTEQAAKQWRGGAKPMPGEQGNYNLKAIAQWLTAKRNYRNMPEDESNRHAMREKIKVETERKLLELDLRRGKLVEREAVAAVNRELFSLVRVRLEALPGEIASSFPADFRARAMEESGLKVTAALKELGRHGELAHERRIAAERNADGIDAEKQDTVSGVGGESNGE